MRQVAISATALITSLLCASPGIAGSDDAKQLYSKHCAACHGENGDGIGTAEKFLYPKARDFTRGVYKFRTTPSGSPPTDDDIYRSIKYGVAGTSMPAWDRMTEKQLLGLVQYVKTFSDIFEDEEAMEKPVTLTKESKNTAQSVASGKKLYVELECNKCHGDEGRGDGPSAATLTDDWDNPITPYDLTLGPLLMKGGAASADIYRTLVTGLDSTPMPSFAEELNPAQTWDVVHYIQSMSTVSLDAASLAPQKTPTLKAVKVNDQFSLNPNDNAWQNIEATKIRLRPLWAMDDWVKEVSVQVAQSSGELLVRMQWQDKTQDANIGNTTDFRDGVAIQHVAAASPDDYLGLPFIGMGDDKEEVTIWQWKSDWQTAIDKDGFVMIKSKKTDEKSKRSSPVDVVKAKGFGTLGDIPVSQQNVKGKAVWKDGVWTVVMIQKLNSQSELAKHKKLPVAVAAWDGSANNRGGHKAVSNWMELELN